MANYRSGHSASWHPIHLHQYDPRSPPDDTRGKHPSLVPSFALSFIITLFIHASTHSFPFGSVQKQQITADNSHKTADNLKDV